MDPDQNEKGGKLKTEIRRVKLKELKLLEKNARYMTERQFSNLVENLKHDGRLTSLPLCSPDNEGRLEVLSGNHRVQAAIEAGIDEADAIVILTPLDPERKVAIQLSHNSITGQDDAGVLLELYNELDLDWKKYSGLNEEDFDFSEIDLGSFNLASVKYEEVSFGFLPVEKEAFLELFENIQKRAKQHPRFVAPRSQFDAFFDAVVEVKGRLNIYNSAVAIVAMCELALERLEQIEDESAESND